LAIARVGRNESAGITEAQRQAIAEAMKLILEEDRDRGIGPDQRFDCPACRANREVAGAILYGETRLCNACATVFEVQRVSRRVSTAAEYVLRARPRSA